MGEVALLEDAAAVQCSQYAGTDARVCLRLLAVIQPYWLPVMKAFSLWRTGEVIDGNIVFSPRGWSDFCR
ncbi:DUF2509 family protein [Escherichia coli]